MVTTSPNVQLRTLQYLQYISLFTGLLLIIQLVALLISYHTRKQMLASTYKS